MVFEPIFLYNIVNGLVDCPEQLHLIDFHIPNGTLLIPSPCDPSQLGDKQKSFRRSALLFIMRRDDRSVSASLIQLNSCFKCL